VILLCRTLFTECDLPTYDAGSDRDGAGSGGMGHRKWGVAACCSSHLAAIARSRDLLLVAFVSWSPSRAVVQTGHETSLARGSAHRLQLPSPSSYM
jgi:hypothetical protein